MRALVLALLCGFAQAAPAPTDEEAQQAHARGQCGKLGPGTGIGTDGRGWIVSMVPGPHEFRIVGGTVGVTVLRLASADLDAGQPTFIAINGGSLAGCTTDAKRGSVCALEWRSKGWDWGPVSRYFLYPPEAR